MQARGGEEEPPEPAEGRRVDQQGGAAPPAPRPDGVEPLATVQELCLPAELLVDPVVEAERGERVALCDARERDQPLLLGVLADEIEVEAARDVGFARP